MTRDFKTTSAIGLDFGVLSGSLSSMERASALLCTTFAARRLFVVA
jgi:hypothetical protein